MGEGVGDLTQYAIHRIATHGEEVPVGNTIHGNAQSGEGSCALTVHAVQPVRLGKAMIGRKATGTGKDKASATEAAQQKLLTELNLAYMAETRVRCSACTKRYDTITNHGLKPIGEAEAIAQAIAAEPAVVSPDAFPPANAPVPTKTK